MDEGTRFLHHQPQLRRRTAQPVRASINGYQIGNRLGSGGMADVFAAIDPAGRPVALKLLRSSLDPGQPALERFLREGRLALTVSSPHLVRHLDVGIADGTPYLVMELLSGRSVEGTIASHPGGAPVEDLVRIAHAAATGLQAIHAAGMVHRDVKPANLLFAEDGRIKLGDFGLMRAQLDETMLTQAGNVLGTPHFMSPEQARGDATIDARADIYSLGATLFMVATGRSPCAGTTPWSVLDHLLREAFPDPRELRADLPEPLAALIRRAGAREIGQRYPDAASLLRDLDDFVTGRAVPVASAAAVKPVKAAAPALPTSASVRVLLVDDDPIIRRIYVGRFASVGIAATVAASLAAARAELARAAPHLVVLDLQLPDGDGLDLLRQLRAAAATASIPVVVLSNLYDAAQRELALAAGATLVAAKCSTTPNRLIDTARRLLEPRAPLPLPPPPAVVSHHDEVVRRERPQFSRLAAAALVRVQTLVGLLHPEEPLRDLRMLEEVAQSLRGVSGSAAAIGHPGIAALAAAGEALAVQLRDGVERERGSAQRTLIQALARLRELAAGMPATSTRWATPPVLLVDDDQLAIRLMQSAAAGAGVDTVAAPDGLSALELLRRQNFALILSDVMMPGLSGERFAQRVREMPGRRSIPLIFVTGLSSFAGAAGAGLDHILKPFMGIELTVKILTAVAGRVELAAREPDPWAGVR